MTDKNCCVIDAARKYITYVNVLVDDQGVENIQNYILQEDERLIDAKPPVMRTSTATGGYLVPVWDMDISTWTEGATADELAAWEAEHMPSSEILSTKARAQRDKLLAETDWTQVLDAPIDTDTREAYRAYRQALRDIPEQEGFPRSIVWPELPAKVKAAPDPVDEAVDLLLSGATGEEAAT